MCIAIFDAIGAESNASPCCSEPKALGSEIPKTMYEKKEHVLFYALPMEAVFLNSGFTFDFDLLM